MLDELCAVVLVHGHDAPCDLLQNGGLCGLKFLHLRLEVRRRALVLLPRLFELVPVPLKVRGRFLNLSFGRVLLVLHKDKLLLKTRSLPNVVVEEELRGEVVVVELVQCLELAHPVLHRGLKVLLELLPCLLGLVVSYRLD